MGNSELAFPFFDLHETYYRTKYHSSAKEASSTEDVASFKLTLTGIGKREGFFRRMFRRGPNLDRKKSKIIKTSNQK